ncbi:hypothetical protein EII29_09695 [Leptotrichia sp. OH3620_COT-345]|uniref:hypothetical protein n=1 Tax=Leptotrichia sp. OH3620_COT-345 TaxID=2491048 RepID=UPI000F655906|nr:hypothetical protein [Leptotrichia sp. OH3620_COT-345]RRD38788.1 hypothetical protein EII29_09695 [Leptotrichia sp. OH3620_COT-345]
MSLLNPKKTESMSIEEQQNMKSEQRILNETGTKVRLAKSLTDNVKNDFEKTTQAIISKALYGQVQLEDIKEAINSLKDIKATAEKLEKVNDNLEKFEKPTLTSEDKEKIYHYYKTGDFKQSELAKSFSTSQTNISRIINEKEKK